MKNISELFPDVLSDNAGYGDVLSVSPAQPPRITKIEVEPDPYAYHAITGHGGEVVALVRADWYKTFKDHLMVS